MEEEYMEELKRDLLESINIPEYDADADVPLDLGKLAEDMLEVISNQIIKKVDKEEGKQLTTNDFTNNLKDKLEKLHNYDDSEIKTRIVSLENNTGSNLEISINPTTYIITFKLRNKAGQVISETSLDLPLEKIEELETKTEQIESKIPVQATSENQLADKEFVNSSISTNTANFIGTFNTLAELQAYSGTITPNDYAFVKSIDILGNAEFRRYKYNGSWLYEYTLNNSSFTAKQWEAINSGITSGLVEKLEGIDLSKFAKKEELPTKTSDLTNDSGFLTEHQSLENYATKKYVEDYVNSLDGNEVLY